MRNPIEEIIAQEEMFTSVSDDFINGLQELDVESFEDFERRLK